MSGPSPSGYASASAFVPRAALASPLGGILAANALLQALDVLSTGLALGSGAVEGNPASAALMERFGFWAWAGLKGLLAVAFLHYARCNLLLDGAPRRVVAAACGGFAAVMAAVVVHNFAVVAAA